MLIKEDKYICYVYVYLSWTFGFIELNSEKILLVHITIKKNPRYSSYIFLKS